MHKMWQGNVHYIEICSGPGRCINRDTADEMDGTALAIMHKAAYPLYKSVTFFDRSQSVVDALNRRIGKLGQDTKTMAIKADYTKSTDLVAACRERAPGGIVLVFLDPTDCSVPMDTVRVLSQSLKNVDFIINVATGTDANRNFKIALTKPDSLVRKKYDCFLGSAEFCANPENLRLAEAGRDDLLRSQFREAYQSALAAQGYNYRAVEVIKHYYDLVFASKHPTGLTFWKKAQSIRPDSQGTLDFETEQ
jgi:three-Cys-motif partner protein